MQKFCKNSALRGVVVITPHSVHNGRNLLRRGATSQLSPTYAKLKPLFAHVSHSSVSDWPAYGVLV